MSVSPAKPSRDTVGCDTAALAKTPNSCAVLWPDSAVCSGWEPSRGGD